jgi:class 3 adenylate cyclase
VKYPAVLSGAASVLNSFLESDRGFVRHGRKTANKLMEPTGEIGWSKSEGAIQVPPLPAPAAHHSVRRKGDSMEASYSIYDYTKSIERLDEILAGTDASYEEHKGIPPRTNLTFLNGYYVDITVLFVDMRGSKDLADKHTRPVLAKIYRSYISEIVAVMKGDPTISEIYIEGDGVWGVFNTTTEPDVNQVFSTAACISSLVDILNIKLAKKKYSTVSVGIGLEDGESLCIKAGYKGSGINEVVWIGRTIGKTASLCKDGNRTWQDRELMVSKRVYEMLTDENKKLLAWSSTRGCYHGNVVNIKMNEWVQQNGQ